MALRLYGLGFGLPFQFHQDEPIVVNHALAFGSGDLNPHFFAIPPLTSYLLFLVYGILYVVGIAIGLWTGTEAFVLQFFTDPGIFYLLGRIFIGVIPGVTCIGLTYYVASKFLSTREALFAAAIMAFSFLNVVNSHYIYTDMLLVVFILLTYIFLFQLYNKALMKYYLFTGISIGLAIGVKYNGFFLIVPFLLTHFFLFIEKRKKNTEKAISFFIKGLGLTGIAVCVTFFLTNPFSLMDFNGFLSSVIKQSGAFWYTGAKHHLFYSLVEGLSWPIVAIGFVGLFMIMLKGKWGVIVVSFPFLYYVLLILRSQHFSRYVIPIVPFFAIGAAYFIFGSLYNVTKNRNIKIVLILLSILIILPTSIKSVKADILFSSGDTRVIAADWISKNLPSGVKIACDSTFFRPALKQPYSQIEEKQRYLAGKGMLSDIKKKKFKYELAALAPEEKGYPLYFLFEDPQAQGQFSDTLPAISYNIKDVLENGIKYVSINGHVFSPEKKGFIAQLKKHADLIKMFSPYYDSSFDTIDTTATTCIPVVSRDIFKREQTGPILKIYKIK